MSDTKFNISENDGDDKDKRKVENSDFEFKIEKLNPRKSEFFI